MLVNCPMLAVGIKNPRTRETTQFVYDVLASRSVSYGRMFNDIDSAKQWLLERNN